MSVETTRGRVGGWFVVIFSYGKEFLSLSEMLERQEILEYLRRKSVEPSREALRKRLSKGLRNGSITKEIVTEYARRAEPVPTPKPILKLGPRTKPIPSPRVRFEIPVSIVKPIPTPRVKPILVPRTRPVSIPRKILSKIRPTRPPRTRRARPVPPPRPSRAKPVPPPRPLRESLKERTCDHGTTEEIDGSIFCIHCGLKTDHQPYKEESRGDKVLRVLTFRKASLKELILPSGRKPPENVNKISKYEKARIMDQLRNCKASW